MNFDVQTSDRRGRGAQAAFPEKANPNRPVPAASGPRREMRGEARPFPERCNPQRSRAPLTDEQRELATRYMPMARTLARQAGGGSASNDDMEAEAYAALVEAARSFNPDRGVDFAFFARPRILGALRDYRRFLFQMGRKGEAQASPVFQRLSATDTQHGRVLGIEPEPAPGEGLESLDAVESIIRLLPRSEATACRSLYVEGKSYAETAAALGCSKGHLSRLHTEAMARLRRVHAEALAG